MMIQMLGVCVIIFVGCLDLIVFALAFQSKPPTSGPDRATILAGAFVLLLVFIQVFIAGTTLWKLGNLEAKKFEDIPPGDVEPRCWE